MASTADRLLGEALKLAPEERARIVAELLATLEPDLPSERRSEGEWIQEIERRARAAIAGSPGVPWAEARNQVQSRLSTQRVLSASLQRRSTSWSRQPCGTELDVQERSPASFPRLLDVPAGLV